MARSSLQSLIWELALAIVELPAAPAFAHRAAELERWFAQLADSAEPPARAEAEESIWTIWCDHPDALARAGMQRGVRALAAGELPDAEGAFDELVVSWPGWAEGWNKRATVYFLQGRDSESVRDIGRTLALEPRHFGALGGFAQICVRNGCTDAAASALERVLLLDPRATQVQASVRALRDRLPRSLH